MPTLVIEDGTGLPNSNSYVTIDEIKSYMEDRGVTLPPDSELTTMAIKGADFVNSYECQFQGERTNAAVQAMAFPRACVELYGSIELDENTIPQTLKTAQCAAVAYGLAAGIDLFPTANGADVTRETVGPLTVEYDASSWANGETPKIPQVMTALDPLFGTCGNRPFTYRA